MIELPAVREVRIGPVALGGGRPLAVIAGPCVIESEQAAVDHAGRLAEIAARAGVPLVYKSSYDKANRTSLRSFRGPGLEAGLRILERVKRATGLPVLSDVHRFEEIGPAAEVLDVLQVPAFLCRQTDFVIAVAAAGKPVNIKKGQFLAPHDIGHVIDKARSTGNEAICVTERGTTFGYHNLVVDMRGLAIMRRYGCPVVFDATHSVQLPGGAGHASGGEREFAPVLARAAVAAGVDAVFMEVHEDPDRAKSDGPNSLPLAWLPRLFEELKAIDALVRRA
ncbi:MAG TPA: 3-deoxy-8-phosphooctulonate synthase [Thermodesulfobacteriota bacterium]|nr:3-deoxy-8-phosphooctulonate synthase [Thermodesulfobacteriota bacterium]